MSNTPLVSVVIPSYNHALYIKQAIESVMQQTYNNIELIVVDDGSTDSSLDIVKDLQSVYNFVLVSQKNMGVCKTLNRAICEHSKGDYISILASDDMFHAKKISLQVAALQSTKTADFCYTQAVEFDTESEIELRVFPGKEYPSNMLNSLLWFQPYAAGSIMFSRELFYQVGKFDSTLKGEDWDFSIRCASKTEFIGINTPLFYYRSHSSNIMKTLGRRVIFREKALILSKNFLLFSPYKWVVSLILHFLYDIIFSRFINLRKYIN